MSKIAGGSSAQKNPGFDDERPGIAAEQSAISLAMSIMLLMVAGFLFRDEIDAWLAISAVTIVVIYLSRLLLPGALW